VPKAARSAVIRISVCFEVEATRLINWFHSLSEDDKVKLKNLWKTEVKEGACTFLYNDRCSIYEARPIICRTQGAPLFIQSENVLDYCPLNFEKADPEKEDWLNLERLNTLLSFAAKTTGEEKRVSLKKVKRDFI